MSLTYTFICLGVNFHLAINATVWMPLVSLVTHKIYVILSILTKYLPVIISNFQSKALCFLLFYFD